ncbi:lactococcin 972 family bacteriocin [Paenibacillus zanthoxyli]|uniref:lactococcin 972 family bacteriocin n=1 Tax=Paenibacillus zanthoxyli TaxID=369399 RepID=UPI000A068D69|nr:lactococcin 972 family bacteriocin [Paenibacillus zanthoxyli]
MIKKRILGAVIALAVVAISGQAMADSNQAATSGSVDLTNAPVLNASVTPFAVTPASVNTGGGTWDYGTSYVFPLSKKVYSNYNHPKYIHSSSCSIGTTESHSGDQPVGLTAYSSAQGSIDDATHAYWSAQYVPGI